MLTWLDMAAVNAASLMAFGFYLAAAVRYGMKRNWVRSLLMFACTSVPWLAIVALAKVCVWFCLDLWGLWLTLAAMKIALAATGGALISCVQLFPVRGLAVPSLIVGAVVALSGSGFAVAEFFMRLN